MMPCAYLCLLEMESDISAAIQNLLHMFSHSYGTGAGSSQKERAVISFKLFPAGNSS